MLYFAGKTIVFTQILYALSSKLGWFKGFTNFCPHMQNDIFSLKFCFVISMVLNVRLDIELSLQIKIRGLNKNNH